LKIGVIEMMTGSIAFKPN